MTLNTRIFFGIAFGQKVQRQMVSDKDGVYIANGLQFSQSISQLCIIGTSTTPRFTFQRGFQQSLIAIVSNPVSIPDFLKASSGLHLALSRDNKLSKVFVYDVGFACNQYNNVGDVQNIPFSYQADFMGLTGGIGPSITSRKGLTLSAKASAAIQTLINGTQFLQNRYIDLADDNQFTGLKVSVGFTSAITQKVNDQISVYTSFQHLDTNTFGSSTLNFIPSTISYGLKIATK